MAPILAQRSRADRAFERLYQRHVGDVYRYSLAVLRNPADAEDVTQTTFLNAYRAFQRGDRPDTPQNWLIKIAHNVCRQRFRTSARKPQEVAFDEDIGSAIVEHDDGPTAQDIQRALGELAFNQRAALVMRELEGRSYAEIGEILGLSLGAVETLIFRARRALREQLEGALTCHEAELAISRQLDGALPREEKGALRAHLRTCDDCATFARSQRAQRSALKALAAVPLPGSLASFFGGTTLGAGTIALKAAAVAATFVVAGAATSVGAKHIVSHKSHSAPVAVAVAPGAAEPISRPVDAAPSAQPVLQQDEAAPTKQSVKTATKAASVAGKLGGPERAHGSFNASSRGRARGHGQSQARGQAKQHGHGRAFAKSHQKPKQHGNAYARGHAKPKTAHPPTVRAVRATPRPHAQPKDNGPPAQPKRNDDPPKEKPKVPLPQVTLPTPPATPVGELKKPNK